MVIFFFPNLETNNKYYDIYTDETYDIKVRNIILTILLTGFDSPRIFSRNNGRKLLPSARKVSNVIHGEEPLFHAKYTHMLMQMGQIIDHDFAHSPVSRGFIFKCHYKFIHYKISKKKKRKKCVVLF